MASRSAEQTVRVATLRTSWDSMTFVHWPVAPEQVQPLLPSGLTVDAYDGAAWVSLTPSVMTNMRPLGVPKLSVDLVPRGGRRRLADLTSTPETNLRTYVRGPDGRDGLWFLSLDVGTAALAIALRAAIGAPYHHAHLTMQQHGTTVVYTGTRVGARQSYRLQLQPGPPLNPSDLEVWLTGRWRAYTSHFGQLVETPVEHEPWPLRAAAVQSIQQNLTDTAELPGLSDAPLVHFSDGVHAVRIGLPRVLRPRS